MSLYHEAAELLTAPTTEGGSLKSRVFRNKKLKSQPNQLYALVLETRKWSPVLKEIIENAELLKYERKVGNRTRYGQRLKRIASLRAGRS
jgi:putative methyltransferase